MTNVAHWVDSYRSESRPGTATSSIELPFPNRGNSASAELLKAYYRPEQDIPRIPVKVSVAAIVAVPLRQFVLPRTAR